MDNLEAEQRKRADAHLAEFASANPLCSLESAKPSWLKGTHLVSFGWYDGRPAAYKFYDGDPRKEHERRALGLYAPTGLVPEVFAETDRLLVMQRLAGTTVQEAERSLSERECEDLYQNLGAAVAQIVSMAPGNAGAAREGYGLAATEASDFYSTPFDALVGELYREADTATFFDTTLSRCAKVLRERDVPERAALTQALDVLAQSRDEILTYPVFVHMDDFHTANIMAQGTRVTGSIDLEMTRYGNEVLFLGAAIRSMTGPRERGAFRCGYEAGRGLPIGHRLMSLALKATTFSDWIRFMWYWSTDDQPWWASGMRPRAVSSVLEAVAIAGDLGLSC